MKQIELVISNPTGLHARPAKVLVKLAKKFKSDVRVQHGEKTANAKSMVSVLTLGAAAGSQITLKVDGEDEDAALAELKAAILSGLGEGEAHTPSPSVEAPAAPLEPALPRMVVTDGAIRGVAAAPGMAIGPIFHFRPVEISLAGVSASRGELGVARDRAREQLAALHEDMLAKNLADEAEIFEAHIEILEDPELAEAVDEHISSGENPVHAWNLAVQARAEILAGLSDPVLAARAADMRDVGQRVLRLLLGLDEERPALPEEPVIVIARELTPSQTAAFDVHRVLGFATTEGGPTSHVAILARALGLPAVVSADVAVLDLKQGTPLILNGNEGLLHPDPAPELVAETEASRERWLAARRAARENAALPAETRDGRRVDVTANAGSAADAAEAVRSGADGIGLLRTEFLFLDRATAPSEIEQRAVYRVIAETMGERPVIIRTLDIGGDKPLAYIEMKPELNPFLGERGVRLCLNRPELFREQLRAILQAAPYGNLKIMFPMVSDLEEWRQARALVEELRAAQGAPQIEMGIMIEVPSAALMADVFAPEIDFFSIGTNDLTQYTLAMDRGHPALAARQDGLHPAVLRLIARTIEAAHAHGRRADICGELASDEAAVPVLLGLGMDEFSVSIPAIPTVKALVRSLNMADLKPLAQDALRCESAGQVRALVRNFMQSK